MTGELSALRWYPLCYLATPYTKYPLGIDSAFQQASALAGMFVRASIKVYSPIAHTHPIAVYSGLDPLDHALWLPFDEAMMGFSACLVVAHLEGWEGSFGIAEEVKVFQRAGKPIFDLDPDTLTVCRRE